MADYPGTLPTFAANGANLSTAPHSALHTDLNQEVVAIATALGTNPQGTLSTVVARLNKIAPYTGALTAWTPAVNQNGAVAVTNHYSRYIRIGRLVHGWFVVQCTGTGVAANLIIVSLPVAAVTTASPLIGEGTITDDSATPDNTHKALLQVHSTGTDLSFKSIANAQEDDRLGVTSTAFAAALTTNDTLRGRFTYESASD